jgi:hypothetical protein
MTLYRCLETLTLIHCLVEITKQNNPKIIFFSERDIAMKVLGRIITHDKIPGCEEVNDNILCIRKQKVFTMIL